MPHRDPAGWPWLKERLSGLRQANGRRRPEAVPARRRRADGRGHGLRRGTAGRLGPGLAADGRLTVVPMPVMVGAEIYGEGEDDIAETIAVALASGRPVKTSRPSPGQFEQAYLAAQRQRL